MCYGEVKPPYFLVGAMTESTTWMAPSPATVSSVGARKVNGPELLRTLAKSAASTAFPNVWKDPFAAAVSIMFLKETCEVLES